MHLTNLHLLKPVDVFLNWITMYKLTLYSLIIWVGIAVIGSLTGYLPDYSPVNILVTAFVAVAFCYISNFVFAKIFKAVTNVESVFITALIIALVVPVNMHNSYVICALVSIIAMASKYLVTIEKRHIINPAVAGMLGMALLFGENSARWWIGSQFMFPFVLAGGFLITRKIRREYMVYTFIGVNLLIVCFASFARGYDPSNFLQSSIDSIVLALRQSLLQSALVFFGTVMLTEPLTSPTQKEKQIYFAIFVAFLHATPQLRLTSFIFTPEMALYAGNIFAYLISPNCRMALKLTQKVQLTHDTALFVFNPVSNFKYKPGQYMEWTLPHDKTDNRGNRRYFSLASSPTEDTPAIVVKYYDPPSSFKRSLFNMPIGTTVIACQLSGDFVMPKDMSKHLVFIAGGVGFAPFRSMIKYIMDNKLNVNITVLFANKTPKDVFYADFLKQAEKFGVKTQYILTDEKSVPANWKGPRGYLTGDMVKSLIPDFSDSLFFISGPQIMVQSIEKTLKQAGVKKSNITTDFFPGYES